MTYLHWQNHCYSESLTEFQAYSFRFLITKVLTRTAICHIFRCVGAQETMGSYEELFLKDQVLWDLPKK